MSYTPGTFEVFEREATSGLILFEMTGTMNFSRVLAKLTTEWVLPREGFLKSFYFPPYNLEQIYDSKPKHLSIGAYNTPCLGFLDDSVSEVHI